MCGIIGYAGYRDAKTVILNGLKKLEYRGYDSFGIGIRSGVNIRLSKHEGMISSFVAEENIPGTLGIGHTRWSTHGKPCVENAHPHVDCDGHIAVVHNGVIDNYLELRHDLETAGHVFRSETDTEVIPHLIEDLYDGDLLDSMKEVVKHIKGSYAILAISDQEDCIVIARNKSPVVLGIGKNEMIVASDVTPILEYTRQVVFLEDGDMARVCGSEYKIYSRGNNVEREVKYIDWDIESSRKGTYKHFMLKEIHEQPLIFHESYSAVSQEITEYIHQSRIITLVANGTSFHSALVFKFMLEKYCGKFVNAVLASEFKYNPPQMGDMVIAITQSGETADTLEAIRIANAMNYRTISVTNVIGSTATRLSDDTLLLRAGPEIGVAATKTFIAQLGVFIRIIEMISHIDFLMEHAYADIKEAFNTDLRGAIDVCKKANHIFFVGRGIYYPIVMEGALKLKEVSYIYAEAFAAGELKHGPFSLLTKDTPVIAICMKDETNSAMISNIKEIKARGSFVIGIGDDARLGEITDLWIPVKGKSNMTKLLVTVVLLQLLAYHVADELGRDVDRPRNLAKSVTVE